MKGRERKKEKQVEAVQEYITRTSRSVMDSMDMEMIVKDTAINMTPSFVDSGQHNFPFAKSINLPHITD